MIMTDKEIALSLIIPTYNCADFFIDTLKELLSHRPEGLEIILSDDGSCDETLSLLSQFEGKYENLTILKNEHHGVSFARNAGLMAAKGKYVAFMDCDDNLHDGFLTKERLACSDDADLYIFGIMRKTMDGLCEYWIVENKCYPTVSDFADEYIKKHKLLLYSVCNKFYKRSVLTKSGLKFEEGMQFGEDRIFNLNYLKACGKIISSMDIMQDYIQRKPVSLSNCYTPNYFETIMKLHRAKVEIILDLSKGTTMDEKLSFVAYDLSNEVEKAINRFLQIPEEKEETLSAINNLAYLPDSEPESMDFLIVLGSRNCGYKAEKALEIGSKFPECSYILSGGNPHMDGKHSEAEFMAHFMLDKGVPSDRVFIENAAECTTQNLIYSMEIIKWLRNHHESDNKKAIGIVSSGFHMPRVKAMVEHMAEFKDENVCYFSAFGPNTRPDNWYLNEYGKELILSEFRKRVLEIR